MLSTNPFFSPFSKSNFDVFLIELPIQKRQASRIHCWASTRANRVSLGLVLVELLVSLSQWSKCSNFEGFSGLVAYCGQLERFSEAYVVAHIFANRMIYNMSILCVRLMVSLRLKLPGCLN